MLTCPARPPAPPVASIVARVAPAARILSLDVFEGSSTPDSVVISAINWVSPVAGRVNSRRQACEGLC
jgi:hypothetical protein